MLRKFTSLDCAVCLFILLPGCAKEKEPVHTSENKIPVKGGRIRKNEFRAGEVLITATVFSTYGITVTIEPGTRVSFRHYRGYKDPDQWASLVVQGGRLKATGRAQKQIRCTSDAEDPLNGDWSGISLYDCSYSLFDYVFVEFGEIGIEQFDSSVPVAHSIIRWNNAECLYAERSSLIFQENLLYENGYHEIGLEQYNKNVRITGNIFRNWRLVPQ